MEAAGEEEEEEEEEEEIWCQDQRGGREDRCTFGESGPKKGSKENKINLLRRRHAVSVATAECWLTKQPLLYITGTKKLPRAQVSILLLLPLSYPFPLGGEAIGLGADVWHQRSSSAPSTDLQRGKKSVPSTRDERRSRTLSRDFHVRAASASLNSLLKVLICKEDKCTASLGGNGAAAAAAAKHPPKAAKIWGRKRKRRRRKRFFFPPPAIMARNGQV